MSLYGFIHKIFGSTEVVWSSRYPEQILDDVRHLPLNIYRIRRVDENSISFFISQWDEKKLRGLLEKKAFGKYTLIRHGLPARVVKYRMRVGLAVGFLLSAVCMFLATRVVWSVEIEGQSALSEEAVRSILSAEGVEEGVWLSTIDAEEKQLQILVNHPEISFVAINIYGNHLKVQVRERDKEPLIAGDHDPYNLVAATGGSILRCEVMEGQTVVGVYESVKEGDLLVSGLVDIQDRGYRIVHARGKVFARTTRKFSVMVPFVATEKRYTGQEMRKKTAIILGKSINLFLNTGISYPLYDTITVYDGVSLFGKSTLPLRTKTVTYLEYVEKEVVRDEKRVRALAYDAYRRWMGETLLDAVVESENIREEMTSEGLVFTVDLVLTENIAREVPFTVEQ